MAAAKGAADSDTEALNVVVIGGGAGGLATAGRLANAGAFNVTVLEQNPEVMGMHGLMMSDGARRSLPCAFDPAMPVVQGAKLGK